MDTYGLIFTILIELGSDMIRIRLYNLSVLSEAKHPVDRMWLSFLLNHFSLPFLLAYFLQNFFNVFVRYAKRLSPIAPQ